MTLAKDLNQAIADNKTITSKLGAIQKDLAACQADVTAAIADAVQMGADLQDMLGDITTPPPSPPPPPVSPPPPPPVSPPPPPPPPSAGFKYVRGLQVIDPTYPASLPAVGDTWQDPTTGAAIERFTDNTTRPDDGGALRNVYSRYPCESIDGKYVLVYGVGSPTSYIYTAGGQFVRELFDSNGNAFGEGSDTRWSYAEPSVLVYHVGMKLYKQDVATGVNTLVHDFTADFPGAGGIANGEEGNSSYDSRYWCFMAQVLDGNGFYPIAIFVYDMQADKIIGTMTPTSPGVVQGATDAQHNPPWPMPNPNMCEISPDGKWALIDWNRCWGTGSDPNSSNDANLIGTHMDGPHAYPLDLDYTKAVKVGVDSTHSAWAQDASGAWGFVSQNNRNDWIEFCDPTKGGYTDDGANLVRIINQSTFGPSYQGNAGFHFAGGAGTPGWVLFSSYAPAIKDPFDAQLVLLPILPNANPLRVSPNYSIHDGVKQDAYFQESAACITNDGLRIYWPGNFGGKVTTDVYRIALPTGWQSQVQP